ncbi:carboxymuconolactone decarboxylase family protein [Rhodoplanes sp. TEM]|uniref:Carboxymuconolactone decarboxylase family protein n=1 Tax=Rhodoplanes tepidamans TaxID=200616 RepID=A0ABT5JCI6_RHOTP|nr:MULTISPECIES: carboxymuconolactone decarboxylase family protein [Rhodoplanes]MDC7787158.1 carboxymuconolactone decarboxylase family protein [Rhodoplanes tepidamans]MDC7984278.1 carboxymuconolactone decarboxylase family protein [Rhodoplanes sp. TEM]MDQ0356075.1 4-carboxymuconolactone decarboxylase [Rhodoplanes tepidamans]
MARSPRPAATPARKPASRKSAVRKSPARAPGRTTAGAAKKTVTTPAKTPAKTRSRAAAPPAYRLPDLDEATLAPAQRDLLAAMRAGPRGAGLGLRGPFGVFLHAPAFGALAQELGAHCRFGTSIPPRLSEFAILVTARLWRAHYEWHVHAPIAQKAGVKPATIADLKAGRAPARAAADEKAVHAFVTELYAKRRVSDRTYGRLHKLFGDAGMVEFLGILGYYALVAMTLDAFRVPVPGDAPLPFPEPKL